MLLVSEHSSQPEKMKTEPGLSKKEARLLSVQESSTPTLKRALLRLKSITTMILSPMEEKPK